MTLGRSEIAAQLRAEIESGTYPADTKLPPYRELAKTLGAAPNTVGEAVRILASEGLVVIKPSSSVVVRSLDEVPVSQGERNELVRRDLTQVREDLRDVRTRLNELDDRVSGLLSQLNE